MSRTTENVRVRRTRTLLRAALVDLIEERGFDRLTVGAITERAMVSRAAFYRNYRDKYHLVEQVFDEAGEALGRAPDERSEIDLLQRLTGFYEHVARYDRLYRALLSKKGSQWFAHRVRESVTAMNAERLAPEIRSDGLTPTLLGAMFLQTLTWWLDNDRPVPPRVLAERYARLAAAIVREAGRPTDLPPAPLAVCDARAPERDPAGNGATGPDPAGYRRSPR